MKELWDAYDKDFNKIDGLILVRGEKIPEGVFHLVCGILVKHHDGSFLLMQRDKNKHFGLMWEATAGGSILKDETPLAGALRELQEETGIIADSLLFLGRTVEVEHNSSYYHYLCVTNCEKDSITLQEGETVAYQWVSKDTLYMMEKSGELVMPRILKYKEEIENGI